MHLRKNLVPICGDSIGTAIGKHTFRASGMTGYLTDGGRIDIAQVGI
jgi:hypothetical protein